MLFRRDFLKRLGIWGKGLCVFPELKIINFSLFSDKENTKSLVERVGKFKYEIGRLFFVPQSAGWSRSDVQKIVNEKYKAFKLDQRHLDLKKQMLKTICAHFKEWLDIYPNGRNGFYKPGELTPKEIQELHSNTPLMVASKLKDYPEMIRLIEAGCDLEEKNMDGNTALLNFFAHECFEEDYTLALDILINAGANVNVQYYDGITHLHQADNIENIKVLINAGAYIDARESYYGYTPLMYTLHNLLGWPLWDYTCTQIATITEKIRFLISAGADVNLNGKRGNAPIHFAAQINFSDKRGNTPLPLALELDILKALIVAGAKVNVKNEYGHTPFLLSSAWRALECLEILQHAGADINARDKWGNTALHYATAARNNNLAKVKYLFLAGVDIVKKNFYGQTPLMCTVSRALWDESDLSIFKLMLKNELNANALADENFNSSVPTVNESCNVDSGLSEFCLDWEYESLLVDIKCLEFLIKSGSDIDDIDNEGNTALLYATKRIFFKSIEFLLEKGANPHARNIKGENVLHLACKIKRSQHAPQQCWDMLFDEKGRVKPYRYWHRKFRETHEFEERHGNFFSLKRAELVKDN
ncbi:ankyrin repeat domain-containing protein [Candidatus Riflebacteria bacterium]